MAKKIGIIISNIGTPETPEPKDVARYLRQFLMDRFVIDIPWPARFLLVKGIIAPFRSKRSSKAYKKIWKPEGSPLLINTEDFAKALESQLGDDFKVVVGMRYSSPSMESALQAVNGCETIVLFPQYPQYAESSTRTCTEAFYDGLKKMNSEAQTYVVDPFFQDPAFVDAVADRVQNALPGLQEGQPLGPQVDHILFSYHGLPERHLTKIDPLGNHCANYKQCCDNPGQVLNTCYRAQAFATSRSLAGALGLGKEQYSVSFQSRLGKQVWIPPYTDIVFEDLVKKGVRHLAVVCPSFVADCLETLEEIAMEGRETFLEAGGESFTYIPCPNYSEKWVHAGAELVRRTLDPSV